jgi:hypothetical protein
MKKNAVFVAENWRESLKVFIIKLTPDINVCTM